MSHCRVKFAFSGRIKKKHAPVVFSKLVNVEACRLFKGKGKFSKAVCLHFLSSMQASKGQNASTVGEINKDNQKKSELHVNFRQTSNAENEDCGSLLSLEAR